MAREALGAGLDALITFENVRFGGLELSRLTLLGETPDLGLNAVALVRSRSPRYAAAAVTRAVTGTLRAVDVRAAIRRSAAALDESLLEGEVVRLADELLDFDVRARWTAIQHPTRG